MGAGCLLNWKEGVDFVAFDRFAYTDNMLRYVTPLMFDRVHSLILNRNIFLEG